MGSFINYLSVFLITLALEELGLTQQGVHNEMYSRDATYCRTFGILHCMLVSSKLRKSLTEEGLIYEILICETALHISGNCSCIVLQLQSFRTL